MNYWAGSALGPLVTCFQIHTCFSPAAVSQAFWHCFLWAEGCSLGGSEKSGAGLFSQLGRRVFPATAPFAWLFASCMDIASLHGLTSCQQTLLWSWLRQMACLLWLLVYHHPPGSYSSGRIRFLFLLILGSCFLIPVWLAFSSYCGLSSV